MCVPKPKLFSESEDIYASTALILIVDLYDLNSITSQVATRTESIEAQIIENYILYVTKSSCILLQ